MNRLTKRASFLKTEKLMNLQNCLHSIFNANPTTAQKGTKTQVNLYFALSNIFITQSISYKAQPPSLYIYLL